MQPAIIAEPYVQTAPSPPAARPATVVEHITSFDAPGPEIDRAAKARFYLDALEAAGGGIIKSA
jgi:hypothetical protein